MAAGGDESYWSASRVIASGGRGANAVCPCCGFGVAVADDVTDRVSHYDPHGVSYYGADGGRWCSLRLKELGNTLRAERDQHTAGGGGDGRLLLLLRMGVDGVLA